jgi:hypothetical protein
VKHDHVLHARGHAARTTTPPGIELVAVDNRIGLAIRTCRDHERGSVVEHFSGTLSSHGAQHSLQISPFQHVLDLSFVGYLMHGCDPNCVLDMQRLRLLALKDIAAGSLLTIDYAVTEDELFRQFACSCGAPNCRRWVTGRSEPVNRKGREYLMQLRTA